MLSQKTRYTIRALMHLADKYQQGLVPLTDIAEAQNIPAKFLTVILSEMSRAGLVVSQRGRDGGYELALPPVDISYGDIIRISRGSLALAIGFQRHFRAQTSGEHHDAHDALGVHPAFAARHPDLARKTSRQFGQLGGSAGVQAQLIADGHGALDHYFFLPGFGEPSLQPA